MRDIVRLKTEKELVRIKINDGNAFWDEIGVIVDVSKLMLPSINLLLPVLVYAASVTPPYLTYSSESLIGVLLHESTVIIIENDSKETFAKGLQAFHQEVHESRILSSGCGVSKALALTRYGGMLRRKSFIGQMTNDVLAKDGFLVCFELCDLTKMPTLKKDLLKVVKFLRWVEAKVVSSEVESEKWRRLLLHQMCVAINVATDGCEEDFFPEIESSGGIVVVVEFVVETSLDSFVILSRLRSMVELELTELPTEERAEFLTSLDVDESGLGNLIRATYNLLGLRTYFTSEIKA
ncbi:hypothetical protein Tco_1313137 [Tanacetum coccineum]